MSWATAAMPPPESRLAYRMHATDLLLYLVRLWRGGVDKGYGKSTYRGGGKKT